tara:strand:- start:194 stop:610 length:417 start_codon:yes stop_codon:yes gene_type:complete
MRTFLLIASALSLTACHSQLQPPTERLAGTWSSTYDGTVIQMIPEDDTHGAYVVRTADEPMQLIAGSYTATETRIEFNDETGPCEGSIGRYGYAILSTAIQFDRLEDECSGRDAVVTGGTWVRVLAPDPKADADSDRR